MVEQILAFFEKLPNELYVFIISMLPIIELRGAVPVGTAIGLPFYINYAVSVIGNMVPIPLILLFIPKILDFLAKFKLFRPMVDWLRRKANKHSHKVLKDAKTDSAINDGDGQDAILTQTDNEKSESEVAGPKVKAKMSRAVFFGLLFFVALPLPGTGAWTGSLVAALFDLPKKDSFLSILLGVMLCGVIMCLASYGVLGFLSFLL